MSLGRSQDDVELLIVLEVVDRYRHHAGNEASKQGNREVNDLGVSVDERHSIAAIERAFIPDDLSNLLSTRGQLVPGDGGNLLALVVEHPVCGQLCYRPSAVSQHGGHIVELRHGCVLVVGILYGKGHLAGLERQLVVQRLRGREVAD